MQFLDGFLQEQNEMIEKQADDRLAKEREMKKKEKDAIKQGKKPFYLKECRFINSALFVCHLAALKYRSLIFF